MNLGAGERSRQRSAEIVVGKPQVRQSGEGVKKIRDGSSKTGIAGEERGEICALGEIRRDFPGGEMAVLADAENPETGKAGEEVGRKGGKTIAVKIDRLEVGHVVEGRNGSSEGVLLKG